MIKATIIGTLSLGGRVVNRVRCGCGREQIVPAYRVRAGWSRCRSCAGLGTQNGYKHGESKPPTPEYSSWSSMIKRCEQPAMNGWELYGGRGIKVCKRWRESYLAFLADMGRKPTPQHTIDRKNVNGNYTPKNCRWATKSEQAKNQRDTLRAENNALRRRVARLEHQLARLRGAR